MSEVTDPIGVGIFQLTVWPTYVGVCNIRGEEPMSDPNYKRGQLAWNMEGDTLEGNADVLVPKGEYHHLIYCYHPTELKIVSAAKLSHPMIVNDTPGGRVEIRHITEDDIRPLSPDPILHD